MQQGAKLMFADGTTKTGVRAVTPRRQPVQFHEVLVAATEHDKSSGRQSPEIQPDSPREADRIDGHHIALHTCTDRPLPPLGSVRLSANPAVSNVFSAPLIRSAGWFRPRTS